MKDEKKVITTEEESVELTDEQMAQVVAGGVEPTVSDIAVKPAISNN